MDVYLGSLGCRVNEAELERWADALQARGHRAVAAPEAADLVVVNSCAVTRSAARKTRQAVSRLRQRSPGAPVVVVGCYVDLEGAGSALPGVDLLLGNRAKEALVERLEGWWSARPAASSARRPLPAAPRGPRRTRAFVKVQDGCRHRCTYCAVTLARGEERSRPLEAVVAEVAARVAAGAPEVVLTGIHLGGYGDDLDPARGLAELVERVLGETAVPRLRLSSLEPWTVTPRLLAAWGDPRLLPHLHLPLQSGSDAVLRRMGRRGSAAGARDLVARVRDAIPEVSITTDVIAGFPGEAAADHERTVALLRELGLAGLHVFSFSPRPGTPAARLEGHLPGGERRRRAEELRALADELAGAHAARFVGQVRPVLWERGTGTPGGAAPRLHRQLPAGGHHRRRRRGAPGAGHPDPPGRVGRRRARRSGLTRVAWPRAVGGPCCNRAVSTARRVRDQQRGDSGEETSEAAPRADQRAGRGWWRCSPCSGSGRPRSTWSPTCRTWT